MTHIQLRKGAFYPMVALPTWNQIRFFGADQHRKGMSIGKGLIDQKLVTPMKWGKLTEDNTVIHDNS